MAIKRCPNGHFYDPDVNSSCPWCALPSDEVERTRMVDIGKNRPAGAEESTIKLSRKDAPPSKSAIDEGHTVAVVKRKIGIDPVVGWFVCIKGPDRGRDYRIRSEKNSIGRADSMDVCISSDDTISRVDHAFVVYDPKKRSFRVQAGSGRGLIYLNGEEVSASEKLNAYDRLEMGRSEFLFIPLCGEEFQWEEEQEA
ncbi:MAG: FHA domain-containing protein [Synergistaceae bacterium]|nr:FHA domain-containing protein [Synergistota bacterium]NLM70666.1 FHA domain-containing protein [Synergistaceae bacterium]